MNMEQAEKVSIVVPVYNAEKYLNDCVNSILVQDYFNFELILVDDGSKDKSPEICDSYAQYDRRVKVIHQKNKGVSEARNTGIEASSGQYIAFIDADDWWSINFLSMMMSKKLKSDLVICTLIRCTSDGKEKQYPAYDCDMSQWCWPILNNYSITCVRCLFDLSIIRSNKIRFATGRKTGEDQEFTFRYMLNTETIVYVSEAKYYYRANEDSTMFTAHYNHFHAVEAMKAVEKCAKDTCSTDRADKISYALRNFKYPYLLEFSILTVITDGEKVGVVMQYLRKNGYFEILNAACKEPEKYESQFMRMWGKSPDLCLYYYYLKKGIGRFLRKLCKRRIKKNI